MPFSLLPRLAPLALAAAALVSGAKALADEPFRIISVEDVAKLVDAPAARLYDANDRKTFEKAHVPGAVFVEYRELSEKDLPADRATQLVFYCKNTR